MARSARKIWSVGDQVEAADLNNMSVFGGDSSDGALSISSGTTTIDLGGAALFVKNYSSISITGTANLAFSNPHADGTIIILRSQGDVTITSSSSHVIDLRLMGGSVAAAASAGGTGGPGKQSDFYLDALTHYGGGGGSGSNAGGVAVSLRNFYPISTNNFRNTRFKNLISGSGGGGAQPGGVALSSGALGGKGAGALLIECAGSYTFTTGTIDASGQDGADGAITGSGSGGGGGGSGGMILVLANIVTADTGTYNLNGGKGGASSISGDTSLSGGGGGALLVAGGRGGIAGSTTPQAGSDDTGTGGAAGTKNTAGGPGGGGAGGFKITILNTEFA